MALALSTVATPGPDASAGVAAQLPDEPAVTFRGIDQEPFVAIDGTWRLELAIEGAPAGASVRGAIYDRFEDRDGFKRALFGVVEGDQRATIPAIDLEPTTVAPGGGALVNLAVTLRSEEDTRPGWAFLERGLLPGVYPIEVETLDAEGAPLARTVVFLARVPSGSEEGADRPPLLVAPVFPVGGPPSVDAGGGTQLTDEVIEGVLATATGLGPTGEMPATLVPRPEAVEALDRDDRGTDALDALGAAARSRQVVDGPYVDVPLSAWVDRGMTNELERQRERGNSVLTRNLGRIDSSTWLAEEGLTTAAAGELWRVGVRTAILPPGASEPGEGSTDGPFTIAAGPTRTIQAVQADGGLSLALDRSSARGQAPDPVLDDGGLAAELALVAELSDAPAGVVLLGPEGWPEAAADVARLEAVLSHPLAPVRPVSVSGLLDGVADRGPRLLRTPTTIDLGDHPQRLALARSRLGSFLSLVGPDAAEVAALDQRLLLSGATSLSGDERKEYVESVLTTVDRRLARIEAPTRQTITLTANDADIPLTLRNQLDVPVTVLIELDSDTRVEFRDGARMIEVLQPGDEEIQIPVHTRVPGESPIDITVRTPDGTVLLDDVEYTVRSTAVSGIGIFLSVGAAGFLLLWWARHWTRARRARRPAPAANATAPPT
jgi:hypothetical protein